MLLSHLTLTHGSLQYKKGTYLNEWTSVRTKGEVPGQKYKKLSTADAASESHCLWKKEQILTRFMFWALQVIHLLFAEASSEMFSLEG